MDCSKESECDEGDEMWESISVLKKPCKVQSDKGDEMWETILRLVKSEGFSYCAKWESKVMNCSEILFIFPSDFTLFLLSILLEFCEFVRRWLQVVEKRLEFVLYG